jgi:hypothetical protein
MASVWIAAGRAGFTTSPGYIFTDSSGDVTLIDGAYRISSVPAPAYPDEGSGDFEHGIDVDIVDTAMATLAATSPAMTIGVTADVETVIRPIDPTRMNFGPAVTQLADCICDAMASIDLALCTCCPSIGPLVGDCDCSCAGEGSGLLRISPGVMGPSRTFPQIVTADPQFDRACPPPYLVLPVNVEISRCVPTIDTVGTPQDQCQPGALASVLAWYTDATVLRQALTCCLQAMARPTSGAPLVARWSLGTTTPVVPQGACAGSLTVAYIGLTNCVDC